MKARLLVAAIGIPLLLLILIWAPDWATALLVAALSIVGSYELLEAVSGVEKARKWVFLPALMGVFTTFATYMDSMPSSPMYRTRWLWLSIFVVFWFICVVLEYGKEQALTFTDTSAALCAGIVIPLALGCLLRLRMMPYGSGLVMIPLVAAFCSDTGAFFVGLTMGKHKLAARVSPKKTTEGAVGGLLGGMLGMVIFRIIFYFCTVYPLDIGLCLLLGLLGSLMGQLGDLSFSVIKREHGIKDYGKILPGHGGVLDRFDSVIFTTPVMWLILHSFCSF
ncbi:MAG: phosphatidate cytidylyltransferase [Oscillibacter sp.]|nr:phosphatidate cytidylyltransferase [Oscillibacter sp.]